ncbi:PH domain-containing protein [Cryobacterium sp. SO1]|uniref:PH domain-containing protein n=1 Tax=Cryobacterium sp. SO1 TaxID=1897061 RepID=UPI001F109B0F|nr:PH domain-containing protein [Cryobacterium sp. SO1]
MPDLPGREYPGSEYPGTDLPGTDLPGTDLPGTDLPAGTLPDNDSRETVAPVGARLDLPEAGEWKRVSPKYVMVEIVGTVFFLLIVGAVAGSLWVLLDQVWAAWVGSLIALITLISLALEPRRVRSIGYQLRADDLLFRRGIMYQRFVSVPYGRMQLVDITRGPVARLLGLADLKFVTAAATSGVAIPGLAEADADALRDRLVELAESRRAGL